MKEEIEKALRSMQNPGSSSNNLDGTMTVSRSSLPSLPGSSGNNTSANLSSDLDGNLTVSRTLQNRHNTRMPAVVSRLQGLVGSINRRAEGASSKNDMNLKVSILMLMSLFHPINFWWE